MRQIYHQISWPFFIYRLIFFNEKVNAAGTNAKATTERSQSLNTIICATTAML